MDNSNLPYNFLMEQLINMNKHTLNYTKVTKFTPNNKVEYLTPKFYSKYEADESKEYSPEIYNYYVDLVGEQIAATPQKKYKYPITESQEIGWIPGQTKIPIRDKRDNGLLFNPLLKNEMTTFGNLLAMSKATERPKFTGLRFRF